ncbi:secondary thiamine-phosphate synthase enzyme [Trichophyton rubrum MR1448]|nr:secondary thiamine-phosphate synthase enzyme [Trichophyton rubrum MR1448]
MTSWSQTTSNRASWLHIFLILIFILAFFPDLFITVPYLIYQLLSSSSQPRAPPQPELPPCSAICTPAIPTMSWFQKRITLPSRSRGSYLVTDHIVSQIPEISSYKTGILHLFVQHTSCALSLNENYDSDVREDMSDALDRIAPEDHKGSLYRHSAEGPDDMPAHVKSSLIGASVTIPITNGRLATGMWQGIWYLEFRTSKHIRNVVATIQGEKV